MLGGKLAGAFEAVEFHGGGLFGGDVFARRLAERGGVGGDIEDVVDDLKREAEVAADCAEIGERGGVFTGDDSAHDERGFDHGGGFVEVDKIEFVGGGVGLALGLEVFDLATNQTGAARGVGELSNERGGDGGLGGVARGEESEGVREQRIAGEEGGGFVEGFVAGGTAAAKIIVVHAREVVVDK